jgi:TATA-binding protein-associated factor
MPLLTHYVASASMLQKFLSGIISEEWACELGKTDPLNETPVVERFVLAKELSNMTLTWLQGNPPIAYHEMGLTLHRIHADSIAMLHAFSTECKLPLSAVPFLGSDIDVTGSREGCFTIETAQAAVGPMFDQLKNMLGRAKKKEVASITERRNAILAAIERYTETKAQYDVRISAAFAGAFVAFKSTPDKITPVVKGIMNGIKASSAFFHSFQS